MNNAFFLINGKEIYNDEKLILTVKHHINKFLVIEDLIVILFDENFIENENIFGYGVDGILKWQVKKIPYIHKDNHYTSIYIDNNGDLIGYNFSGIEVTIDKKNGDILYRELIR